MSYNFQNLQTIECDDSVSLRVPARWQFETNPDRPDRWCCYEENVETGTLWISIDRFSRPERAALDSDIPPRRTVDEFVAFQTGTLGAPIRNSAITETGDGYLWTYDYETVERGERLHNFRSMFFSFGDEFFAYTDFIFVLLAEQVDDPEFRDLIAMMDREIRAARITPFSPDLSDDDSDPLASLRRANFAGQIALNLPETLEARPFGDEDHQWYCYFDPDIVEARLRVISDDQKMRDEDGDPVSVDEAAYEDIVRGLIETEDGDADIDAVPNGILVHKQYDDNEQSTETDSASPSSWQDGPLHFHSWRYFRFAHGTLRRVSFLLTLPLPRAETGQSIALVELIDREIRRADFPDLES